VALESFIQPLIEPARINSLAQTLLKLTAPGIPDFYQGTELWDLSLVDPTTGARSITSCGGDYWLNLKE
jgi:maltooligosyltrehalose synthase